MPATDLNKADDAVKSRVNVTISKDSMSATVLIRKPGEDDPQLTIDEIMTELNAKGIVHGLDHDAIENIVLDQIYNSPIKVAGGTMPERGENSKFEYQFDTKNEHKPQVDIDGRIDYKNISFIQNIKKDEILVIKIPPTSGKSGINIFGSEFKGPDGLNLPFKNGNNTYISENDLELRAATSGAIIFLNGKVSVNDVTTISGDVDFNVGNLNCLGSIKVSGDIKTGFSVKCDGDLEVNGKVEDCIIDVQGNVMIKGGFFGKGDGYMKAGGDVFVKFAEGQKIEAGGDVIVGGEVINCHIITGGNIHVQGKKGKIIGGELYANKEIRGSFIGNKAGTKTYLTVAYDHELMNRYYKIIKEIERLNDDAARIKEAMIGLYKLQIDNRLTPEQADALTKFEDFKKNHPATIEKLEAEKETIENTLKSYKDARVVVEGIAYQGVRTTFGLIYRDLVDDLERSIISMDDDRIFFTDLKPGDL